QADHQQHPAADAGATATAAAEQAAQLVQDGVQRVVAAGTAPRWPAAAGFVTARGAPGHACSPEGGCDARGDRPVHAIVAGTSTARALDAQAIGDSRWGGGRPQAKPDP